MEIDKKQKNLENLKKFFEDNMFIKIELIELTPTLLESYNQEARIEYSDRAYDSIKNIKASFLKIINSFDLNEELKEAVTNKIDEIESQFFENVYKGSDLKSAYKKSLIDMDRQVIKETHEKCYGYAREDITSKISLINNCQTYNELLHVLHSYITNNEKILKSMPLIETKRIDNGHSINLYGVESKIAKQIFDNFQNDSKVGETEIVSLGDERVLMMVRDVGHALTIDINKEKEDKTYYVDYFIPKICNAKKVNKLKGVIKVKENTQYFGGSTIGCFRSSSKGNVGVDVVEFIEAVPTDADIEPLFDLQDYATIAEMQKASEMKEFLNKFKDKILGGKEDDER